MPLEHGEHVDLPVEDPVDDAVGPLRALRVAAIDGVTGTVAGRAIYEKVLTVREGRRALEEA